MIWSWRTFPTVILIFVLRGLRERLKQRTGLRGSLRVSGCRGRLEPFHFTNWTLLDNASLVIDEDGNSNTVGDQASIDSFQCEHLSWPTPIDGVFADLVVLPLPVLSDRSQIGTIPINMTLWDSINTTGKIVLVGREVRSHPNWNIPYANRLRLQPPAAVVYTWWYIWDCLFHRSSLLLVVFR